MFRYGPSDIAIHTNGDKYVQEKLPSEGGGALLIWAAEEGLGPKPRLRSSPSFLVPTAVPIFGWVRGNWVHFGTTPDLSASRLGQSPPARSGDGARG